MHGEDHYHAVAYSGMSPCAWTRTPFWYQEKFPLKCFIICKWKNAF